MSESRDVFVPREQRTSAHDAVAALAHFTCSSWAMNRKTKVRYPCDCPLIAVTLEATAALRPMVDPALLAGYVERERAHNTKMTKLRAILSEPHHLGFPLIAPGVYESNAVIVRRDWYYRVLAAAGVIND